MTPDTIPSTTPLLDAAILAAGTPHGGQFEVDGRVYGKVRVRPLHVANRCAQGCPLAPPHHDWTNSARPPAASPCAQYFDRTEHRPCMTRPLEGAVRGMETIAPLETIAIWTLKGYLA